MSFILFSLTGLYAQKKQTPADKALAAIDIIEKGEYNIKLPTLLACLTLIFPKNVDLNYSGVCYQPTKKDLEMWRTWVLTNKENLQFKKQESEANFDFIFGDFNIIFTNGNGTSRDSNCQ